MSATTQEPAVRVAVAADRSAAELVIAAGMDRAMMTPDVAAALLEQAGVEVTAPVRQAVAALLSEPSEPGREARGVVARARPPVHGRDGRVEWLVDSQSQAPTDAGDDGAEGSYYGVSAFTMVEPGQTLGKLHPPTAGEDGRDVTGKPLAAKQGKESRCKLDETILCDASGNLIAQAQGVLTRTDSAAFIRKVLEVPDYVDFSTGNIDFQGDVLVGKGVRDLFVVKAAGDVEVAGLIEAATIVAGHDLNARGGFAGRERGEARTGGDLRAKYLDNIRGEITGVMEVDREVINCDLVVHGSVESPHCAVIGGRLVVAGPLVVGHLGSGADVATEVVVGSVPRLEPLYERLRGFVENISRRREALGSQHQQLAALTGKRRATAADKERLTELTFELSNADAMLAKAQPAMANLSGRIEAQRTVDARIECKLHSGVVFILGHNRYHVDTAVKGPVRIVRDDSGVLAFERGDGGGGLLVQIGHVDHDDTDTGT